MICPYYIAWCYADANWSYWPAHAPLGEARETPAQIRARRLGKRRSAVAAIKASPNYVALQIHRSTLRDDAEDDGFQTPDAEDDQISKRQWESSVMHWRRLLAAARAPMKVEIDVSRKKTRAHRPRRRKATTENGPATIENGPATTENGPATTENGPATAENGSATAENAPPRDGRSLPQREEESLELLAEAGVDYGKFTLEEAVSKHRDSKDKDFRRALRVAIAKLRLDGKNKEDKDYQLNLFYLDLAHHLADLDIDEHETVALRSAFLKAATDRAWNS